MSRQLVIYDSSQIYVRPWEIITAKKNHTQYMATIQAISRLLEAYKVDELHEHNTNIAEGIRTPGNQQ